MRCAEGINFEHVRRILSEMAAAFRFVQCPSQLARTRRRGTATGPIAAVAAPASQFHAIDRSFPGIEVAIEEPPVFVVRGALSNDACDALVKAAEAGQMPPVSYDNSVHLDMHRLRPLPLMVAVGAAIPAWHAAEAGGDAAAVLAAFAGAAAVGGASVAALCWAAVEILQATVGRNIFTGSKWNAARVEGDIAAERAVEDFFRFVEILLSTSRDLCERPLVTRYAVGEEQKVHLDARPAGDASMAQFEASGGQRLVQVRICRNLACRVRLSRCPGLFLPPNLFPPTSSAAFADRRLYQEPRSWRRDTIPPSGAQWIRHAAHKGDRPTSSPCPHRTPVQMTTHAILSNQGHLLPPSLPLPARITSALPTPPRFPDPPTSLLTQQPNATHVRTPPTIPLPAQGSCYPQHPSQG